MSSFPCSENLKGKYIALGMLLNGKATYCLLMRVLPSKGSETVSVGSFLLTCAGGHHCHLKGAHLLPSVSSLPCPCVYPVSLSSPLTPLPSETGDFSYSETLKPCV